MQNSLRVGFYSIGSDLLLLVGDIVLLKLLKLELLKFPLLQDLQHICLYPAMEQYRLNTSIRQNTDRSPRQRCPGDKAGAAMNYQSALQLSTVGEQNQQWGIEEEKEK